MKNTKKLLAVALLIGLMTPSLALAKGKKNEVPKVEPRQGNRQGGGENGKPQHRGGVRDLPPTRQITKKPVVIIIKSDDSRKIKLKDIVNK